MAKAQRRIEPYLDRLYGYALSLTGDPQDAMDLVQECAARAIGARRIPDDASAYRAWLFRILRNIFLDSVRRQRHAPEPMAGVEETNAQPGAWHCERDLIASLTVRMGMRKLSPDHRDIISLVDIAGLSYAETAALLGIPEGTVMSRLSRARRALLDHISAENIRPFPMAKKSR
jgi:RNA polymerase sigma-70 factor (ECF subfamily)